MCGNDVSTIVSPATDFFTLVSTQIPSGKIKIKNYPFNPTHANQLQNINTSHITQLTITKSKINHDSMQELVKVNLPYLTTLNLCDNELGLIGCRILADSQLISTLVELNLNNNKIRDQGIKALAGADLANIQDLSLSDNGLTTAGVEHLKGALPNVECLNLAGNKLSDSAVALINQINPNIIYFLKLSRNELSEDGVKQIVKAHNILQVLVVDRNKIKQASKDKFKKTNLYVFC